MITAFTAFTHEIDDIETALAEIQEQLDLGGKNTLLANTVGIVSCFAEYVESGVWKALCDALPFEVVGTTTIANAVGGAFGGEIGETMLALTVLTSDELAFSLGLSEPITEEDAAPLHALYQQAVAKRPEKPAFMLTFSPLLNNFGSDFYVDCMTEISGNLPNFGPLAVDHNPDYHESYVLLNGEHWRDRFAILLVYGDIRPVFYVGTISDDKVFPEKGVVTAAAGNQLQTVDGVSVMDYLQSLGLTKNEEGTITGINSFPIIVDYNDGTLPVARAMFALTPEGHAVCGGNIPVGATLTIGSFSAEEIVGTTGRTLEKALEQLEQEGIHFMLMYSCVGRYFAQGYNPEEEFRQLSARMEPAGIPYMAAYSGGELCPVYGKNGETVNRNHNNTFIICAF